MKVLLTGGNGFIGKWVAKRLLEKGINITVFGRRHGKEELADLVGAEAADKVRWYIGDVSEYDNVLEASEGCDAIIHIAALLGPDVAKNPRLGMKVNLGGTLNIFEAAKKHKIEKLIYTTSAAVFGPEDGLHPKPILHYGALKLAEEGCARAYFLEDGIVSIGFRPFVVYGPCRERGLSAGPSLACMAAARGKSYVIPFTGKSNFIYVDDCASAYERALFSSPEKAEVFNLAGEVVDVNDFIREIKNIVPEAKISAAGPSIPIAPILSPDGIEKVITNIQRTPMRKAIEDTIDFYRGSASQEY